MARFFSISAVCVAAAVVVCAVKPSAGDTGSGSMTTIPANHQMFVGSWNCTVKLGAMAGMPATTDTGVMTISMSPGMTMQSHVTAKDYMSDSFEGYNANTKTWWITLADIDGTTTYETSKDHKVYTGTAWQNGRASSVRDTRTFVNGGQLHDITEIKTNGTWVKLADGICAKQ
jgi:hypothetical protein